MKIILVVYGVVGKIPKQELIGMYLKISTPPDYQGKFQPGVLQLQNVRVSSCDLAVWSVDGANIVRCIAVA